jgi:hypothetical protein
MVCLWGRLEDVIMNLEPTEINNLEKITNLFNNILDVNKLNFNL